MKILVSLVGLQSHRERGGKSQAFMKAIADNAFNCRLRKCDNVLLDCSPLNKNSSHIECKE